eukprot:gb/GECG01005479.1/.p1 GENE.gb/GECG01005479.1/~~gb/GECG01005479.1/.p1  ORF type:complete len:147 (+),score=12.55 gb/GECG01005479.1/:1-441(+)
MFRKFDLEDVSAQSKVKSSTQRGIKRRVADQYEPLEPYLDDIIPKGTLQEARCKDKLSIYVVEGEPLFFQHRDGPVFPTLKLLHKYPFFMPSLQVDKGAIKFIFSGADIMCPGLTSKGGKCDIDVPESTPVVSSQLPLSASDSNAY